MSNFERAPKIPCDYMRLNVLSPDELTMAVTARYVAGPIRDGSELVGKVDAHDYRKAEDNLIDWRTRIYVVWFCYIYENMMRIDTPLEAIETIVSEFRAPSVIDTPGRGLGALYAGMGATNPVSGAQRERHIQLLKPHYDKAIALLGDFEKGKHG